MHHGASARVLSCEGSATVPIRSARTLGLRSLPVFAVPCFLPSPPVSGVDERNVASTSLPLLVLCPDPADLVQHSVHNVPSKARAPQTAPLLCSGPSNKRTWTLAVQRFGYKRASRPTHPLSPRPPAHLRACSKLVWCAMVVMRTGTARGMTIHALVPRVPRGVLELQARCAAQIGHVFPACDGRWFLRAGSFCRIST